MLTVAAIPVHNEADRIAACLRALDAQRGSRLDHIVLLVNNTSDATATIARACRLHPATTLHVLERCLSPEQANAGHARRLAMTEAAHLAGADGVLLTTDADGMVDTDWLAATLRAFAAGADVVAGWVDLHPEEWAQIPIKLHEDDAAECAYDALCDEIHARLDPDPADPTPRHTQNSGASIAVSAAAYARCGGVPPLPSGEDRALIAALRRVDARIRHAPDVHVSVSGRTVGRSPGGMADTIRRRLSQPDTTLDDRLEPAEACARRARARAALCRLWMRGGDGGAAASELAMTPQQLRRALDTEYFGQAWERVEQAAPALRRRLVEVSDLPMQMAAARAILAALPERRDDRSDNDPREPEALDHVR